MAALGCASSALAASAAPSGKLSEHEFGVLRATRQGLETASRLKDANAGFKAATAQCERLAAGTATPLLVTVSTQCADRFSLEQSLSAFPTVMKHCSTLSKDAVLNCQVSAYQQVAKATGDVYKATVKLQSATVARGFKGKCLTALAYTRSQLKDWKHLLDSANTIAAYYAQKAHGSTATKPANPITRTMLSKAGNDFSRLTVGLFYAKSSPLAACPRQKPAHPGLSA